MNQSSGKVQPKKASMQYTCVEAFVFLNINLVTPHPFQSILKLNGNTLMAKAVVKQKSTAFPVRM